MTRQDCFIENGQFTGDFEDLYQNVDDPWFHGKALAPHYDSALELLGRHVIPGGILDLGCGKGAFTARLAGTYPLAEVTAVDIAPTAIRKAKVIYGELGIDFRVFDVRGKIHELGKDFDLVVMSDLMWYILPEFEHIISNIAGWLLINQTFYKLGVQKYGNEIVSSVEDMLKLIPYDIVEITEVGHCDKSYHVVALFRQREEG